MGLPSCPARGTCLYCHTFRSVPGPCHCAAQGARSRSDGRLLDGEALRLVAMAGHVFYVAKVAHNEYPVAFRLVDCDVDRLVFANPAHDFPRRIEYRRTGPDAFDAHVSDGATKGFRLDFRREPGG